MPQNTVYVILGSPPVSAASRFQCRQIKVLLALAMKIAAAEKEELFATMTTSRSQEVVIVIANDVGIEAEFPIDEYL
jgi:hypothetical protein